MQDERLCAQGHVVEADRETCSRCNGPVLKPESDNADNGEQENETMITDESENTEAGAASSDTGADTASSEEAGSADKAENTEAGESASAEGSSTESSESDSSDADSDGE